MARLIELNLHPDARTLRRFGWVALIVFGLLAACAWHELWMFHSGLGAARTPVAVLLFATGLQSGFWSLVYPRANRALYVAISVAGYPVGVVVSYVVLAVLFYAVFMPAGVLLRMTGRDPLQRRWSRESISGNAPALRGGASSYWSKARPAPSKKSYFSQF